MASSGELWTRPKEKDQFHIGVLCCPTLPVNSGITTRVDSYTPHLFLKNLLKANISSAEWCSLAPKQLRHFSLLKMFGSNFLHFRAITLCLHYFAVCISDLIFCYPFWKLVGIFQVNEYCLPFNKNMIQIKVFKKRYDILHMAKSWINYTSRNHLRIFIFVYTTVLKNTWIYLICSSIRRCELNGTGSFRPELFRPLFPFAPGRFAPILFSPWVVSNMYA
jgi:hypothetical protein